MDSCEHNSLGEYYAKIVEVFSELGYPQDLIGQWTLPQRDAQTLMGIIQECRPQNILEVGTFVGVTTLLMALMSSPDTHIHSIDPNFPLKVEMESMRSNLYDSNTTIKAQYLGLQVAQILGIDHKITFHEGGFSTENTFASYNTSPSSQVTIIGHDVCKNHGPFDFIFIDGLHYEEDVFSDLSLAAEHLVPFGSIAVHDVLGRWGSNVRRGIFRFLEKRDNFRFSHDNYAKVYDSIGLLQHNPKEEKEYDKVDLSDIQKGSLFQEKFFSNLGAVLIKLFSPTSVVQIGGNIAFLKHIINFGVPDVSAFVSSYQGTQQSSFPIKQLNMNEKIPLEKRYDICLCFEMMDLIPNESIDNIIQACVDASDTIILANSPPGEMGKYHQNNKPLTYWIGKFYEKGYLFSDAIRPLLEPHLDIAYAENQENSSYLMNTYLVRRDQRLDSDQIDRLFLEEIIISKERRIEDLELQNLYQKCIIQQERKKYIPIVRRYQEISNENRALIEEINSINILNRRVLRNTINRTKEIINNKLHLK
jgi:hypothetical protein